MGFLNNMIVQSGQFEEEKVKFSGEGYATFTMKVTESVYDKSTKSNDFQNRYWDFKVFGKAVDSCRNLKKGMPITVYGELDRISTWETDKGEERINVNLIASRVSKCPKDFSESEAKEPEEEQEEEDPFESTTPTRKVPPPRNAAKEAAKM